MPNQRMDIGHYTSLRSTSDYVQLHVFLHVLFDLPLCLCLSACLPLSSRSTLS